MQRGIIFCIGFALLVAPALRAQAAIEFTDAENRIVFVGGGFIEQARLSGYIEARLLRRFPDRSITCRNLGWSGDSVWGAARTAGFENPAGRDRLIKETSALKPTMIFVGYGFVESFEGNAALGRFTQGYNQLLDALGRLTPKLVLLSPTCHENDAEHNGNLERYTAAIAAIAAERSLPFVDLYHPLLKFEQAHPQAKLTSNSITPNDSGYWVVADEIERQLGLQPEPPRIELDANGKVLAAQSAAVTAERTGDGLRFQLQLPFLPAPALTEELRSSGTPVRAPGLSFRVTGLAAGKFALLLDNHEVMHADAREWDAGVSVPVDSDRDIAEKLRQTIIRSNELFYRRSRPFNDHSRHWTYIGGDFALYDKQLAELDKEIALLRRPVTHEFKIIPKK